jgi:hypothetical protein
VTSAPSWLFETSRISCLHYPIDQNQPILSFVTTAPAIFQCHLILTMGLTNFRHPSDLLARAGGSKHELQAMIQEFNCPVYINYTSFSQETIEQCSWRLEYCHLDQWAAPTEDGQQPVTNTKTPDPIKVPKLCISPCLKYAPFSSKEEISSKLDYIFLVEGNRGANLKLVVQHDLHDAGVNLFHEAMNGYSVIFSGAILKTAFRLFLTEPRQRLWKMRFQKVGSMEELLEKNSSEYVSDGPGVNVVLILC